MTEQAARRIIRHNSAQPCPECVKRLPPLPEGKAPVDGCACRLCKWLRANAEYVKRD